MNHQARWDEGDVGLAVWVSDEAEGYIEATITAIAGNTVTAQTKANKRVHVDVQLALQPPKRGRKEEVRRILPRSTGGPPNGVENMDDLIMLNEAEILSNIQLRFRMDNIYTRTGPILIAMNPFKWLPLYGEDVIRQYHNRRYGDMPPHCYAEAEDAYQSMRATGQPQAVVICGESGAGKTETTKLMLQYLSTVASEADDSDSVTLGDQMVQANALMEAFGNAKTTRNNNSSRFGKFTMFNFDSEGFVMGGRVTEFLLEKSRVTAQADGERNYHIFYQLVEGLNPTLADLFEMHDVADFDYLNATESEVEGLDDKEDFESTQAAMDAIGMYPEEQEEVMRVVASVLHLGNMDFSASADGESCHVSDPASALAAARLLGVDATDLGEALNSLVRMLPTGTVISPVTSAQARSSRDALAKMVYARLFNWVIRRINSAFDRDASNVASFIGVLDIFGFENMKSNKFEQLFINYTNEQLQYLFNETVFKQEEEEYQREQIQWDKTAFPDNTSCIELLSKKPLGLLPFMDSECSRGAAASDEGLVSKWHKTHKSHPNYEVCGPDTVWRRHDGSFTENTDFLIKHFAGPVIYSCQKFIEKNQDAFYDHIYDIVADSSSPLVQALFPTREADQSSQEKTVSARFVNQMRELVNTLQSTEIRFVRCIKSNDQLKPQLIDKANVLRQLVCSGVTAALEVRRAGYPSRVLYHEFVRRFRVFDTGSRPIEDLRASRDHAQIELALSRAQHGDRETTARMMTHPSVLAKVSGDQYRLGLTKLFLQADVLQILERIRNTILLPYVIRIQRWWMRSKSNYLQHALNRAVSKLSSIISRAKLGRIQHQAVVRYALEEAAAAARYAKGLGLVAPDMSKNVLLTLQTKNELAEKAVEEAINAKEAAARERAALLEQLDSGVIRLRTVDRQTPELQRQARLVELTQMVVRASRAIESCRTALIRAASQADLSSGPEASTKHSSVLKRSFTKAMLIVSRDDDDGQSTTAGTAVDVEQDLSSHEDEVSAAMEMVEQAEQLCQQLLNDKYRVDQARAAYTSNLAVTRSTLEHSFRKADETGVTGSVIVQHTFNAAREALEYADKCLDGNDQGLFESSVQRAAECVDEASSVVEKEAEFRTQELARNRANSILQLSQKKYRQVLADAELYGVQDMPTFSRCAALAEDALNATALLDEGDGLAFEAAAEHAQAKVNNLVEACTAEKQLKSRLDTEKREELRKLEPAVGNLAALKTKLEFAGVNDDKVRQAVEDAQFAIERARDAIRKTDSISSVRSFVSEAIAKAHSSERILMEEKQRKDALDRETGKAHKQLSVFGRSLEELAQTAEASGVTVVEILANALADSETAISEAYRSLKRAETVTEIKALMADVAARVRAASETYEKGKARITEVQAAREKDTQRASELRRVINDTIEVARISGIYDLPSVRAMVTMADNAVSNVESRLSKPITLAWLDHDGAAGDAAALNEADVKVDEAEATVISEKRRAEFETRETRSNQASMDFVRDRLQGLQSQATASGVDNLPEISSALSEARSAVEAAASSIMEGNSAAIGKAAVDVAVATLDAAESAITRSRISKEGQEKEKSAAQVILDMSLTKLQGVVATADASGPVVSGLVEREVETATEAINVATRLLRRGEDVSTFAVAVHAAMKAVDAADSAAFIARQRVADARRVRNIVSCKFESLVETFEVMAEKAVHSGVKHLPQVTTALGHAENVLQLCRPRAMGSIEDFLYDSLTVQRMVVEAAQKVQEAEEMVDMESQKRDKANKERAVGRVDFERWLQRHARCVNQAEKWGISDVGVVQQALTDAEREIESAGPALRAGNLARVVVLSAKVQHEEEVIALERQKKERRQLELQRVRKELPALQRRVAQMETNVDAAGPIVAVLVEHELADAQRAMHQLQHYLDFGEHMTLLQPALDETLEKVAHAEDSCNRAIQRVRKARAEKLHEQNKLNVIEARFRETSRTVARFCAKSDHLRLQLSAEWSDMCWWGSQVKHASTDGAPIGRGEIRPVPAVTALAEALSSSESALATARQKVEICIEEWLKVGAGPAHHAVEEAVSRVEHATEVCEAELEKLQAEERERRAASATLDSLTERVSGITAVATLSKINDMPRVADILREAEHAIQVVGLVLSSGNVAAAAPALKVAEKVVSEAAETVALESSKKERLETEKSAAQDELTQAKKKLDDIVELVKVLELADSPVVSETIVYADKAVQAAQMVLRGDFAPAVIAKEAAEATKATEEAERAAYLEKGRREQLARLRSHREVHARQAAQRRSESEFRKHEEELRRRREMQDSLESAVHRLTVQWPALQEARGSVVAAESAVDAARQKLSRGRLSAANEAVRAAIERVDEAAAVNMTADAAAGGTGGGRALPKDEPDSDAVPSAMESPKSAAPKPEWMTDYVKNASDYMGRTTTAFEAMTANMHFLTQGLLEVSSAMSKQNQVLSLQTNILTGVGDKGAQMKQLVSMQQQPPSKAPPQQLQGPNILFSGHPEIATPTTTMGSRWATAGGEETGEFSPLYG